MQSIFSKFDCERRAFMSEELKFNMHSSDFTDGEILIEDFFYRNHVSNL